MTKQKLTEALSQKYPIVKILNKVEFIAQKLAQEVLIHRTGYSQWKYKFKISEPYLGKIKRCEKVGDLTICIEMEEVK